MHTSVDIDMHEGTAVSAVCPSTKPIP